MKKYLLFFLACITFFGRLGLYGYTDPSMNVIVIDDRGCPIDPYTLETLTVEGLEGNFATYEGLQIDEGHEAAKSLADMLLDGIFLRMAGYYSDQPPEVGIYGSGNIHDKARITLINGILNVREDVIGSARLISESHGGTNVHYIFRPTLGWGWDIVKSTFVKCGFISQQAQDIAFTWKALIQEMGGAEGGGTIYHYAHSIGAADTYTAKFLLLPEELAMVSVVTFGSPIYFPNHGFKSVENYASVRDFVPFLKRLSFFYEDDNNVIYTGSYFGIPFIDHLLENEAYRSVIETLGQEFIQRHT